MGWNEAWAARIKRGYVEGSGKPVSGEFAGEPRDGGQTKAGRSKCLQPGAREHVKIPLRQIEGIPPRRVSLCLDTKHVGVRVVRALGGVPTLGLVNPATPLKARELDN